MFYRAVITIKNLYFDIFCQVLIRFTIDVEVVMYGNTLKENFRANFTFEGGGRESREAETNLCKAFRFLKNIANSSGGKTCQLVPFPKAFGNCHSHKGCGNASCISPSNKSYGNV